jgi:pimeloyl-ACP methyl ester carboxylesterase
VLEAGSNGIPAVLVHGVGARADRWRANLEGLAEAGLHAYAIDLPGHGFAAKGDSFAEYSAAGYASFVKGFLRSIGADRAVLIGTSLGGHVAGRVACDTPERVMALVMVGTLGVVPMGPEVREAIASSLGDASESGVRGKLTRVLHKTSLITEEWVGTESRINSSPGAEESFSALAQYFRDRIDDDLIGDCLARLETPPPMLLVWGQEDVSVPVAVGERAQQMLGSTVPLRTIESTGHLPYLEAAPEFNRIVAEFLRSAGVLPSSRQPHADTKEDL